MASSRERIKHEILVAVGLEREPTDAQVDAVINDMAEIVRIKGTPTKQDWRESAGRHIGGLGRRIYAGENLSTLNTLLIQILNQGGQGTTIKK